MNSKQGWSFGVGIVLVGALSWKLGMDSPERPQRPEIEAASKEQWEPEDDLSRQENTERSPSVTPGMRVNVPHTPPPSEPENADLKDLLQGMSKHQQAMVRFLIARTETPENEVLALLAKPGALVQMESVYDQFMQALGDAMEKKEKLLGEVFESKLERGDYTERLAAEPRLQAAPGELVVSGVFWSKELQADVRRVAKIWRGESPELDMAIEQYSGVEASITDAAKSCLSDLRNK